MSYGRPYTAADTRVLNRSASIDNPRPTVFVLTAHFIVWNSRVAEGNFGFGASCLEGNRNY
jgi:hypothetical protein